MNRKNIRFAGLCCALLFTCATQTQIVHAASPSLSASADTGSASKGDYVNIDVELGNNPSISTLGAALSYDSSVLKYDSSTWNGSFSGSDMQMASDTGSEVNLSVVCDDSYAADGTVVTVRFQAVKDTDSIPVTLSLRDMADADLAAVSDCQVAGTVSAPQTTAVPEQAAEQKPDSGEDDFVDLDDPQEASRIDIVDEESGAEKQPPTVQENHLSGELSASAQTYQQQTKTQTVAAKAANTSSLDRNYKTGAGIGADIFLIAASICGILALVFTVRHRNNKEEP
ncbi:MAG: hypothetical protein HFH33_08890 [Eubacterium sp.]|nr:hypothetical protein [Eubacterium sp.]